MTDSMDDTRGLLAVNHWHARGVQQLRTRAGPGPGRARVPEFGWLSTLSLDSDLARVCPARETIPGPKQRHGSCHCCH